MAQPGFIFGGNTGMSYDQIQKQRDIANQLLRANMSTPQNVGEGLSAIGRALAAKAIDKRTSRADDANRVASEQRRASAIGSIFGGGGGGASGSPAPFSPATSSAEVGPAASVANDTMAVLGNFSTLEQQHNLPAGYLSRTYKIESGGNPMAQNPNSSAGGGFQFIDSTAKAYGLTDKFNLGESASAAARLAADNKAVLTQALGREPTAGELYLAHQQGGGGAAKLLANPNARAVDIVGADAVRLNGGNENMTASEFASKWVGKFGDGAPAPAAPTGGVDPANIKLIADLLADPYTPPGEKVMLEQAMAMALQGMDPMRQMEMERARLELDQMRNPQPPELPADVVELQWRAENAGLVPGTPEYQEFIRTGGSGPLVDFSGANIGGAGEVGTIPQGFELFTDAQGNRSMRPIPGGPEDPTKATEAAKGGRDIATQTVTSAASRAREAAENRVVGGALSGIAAMNPASQNAEIYRQVEVLKSQAIVNNLQAMRDASPTGGALGAVTAPELKMLADKSGALDPRSDNFIRDLNDYELSLLQTIHGPEEGKRIFEATRDGAPPPPDQEAAAAVAADPAGFQAFSADPSAIAAAQKYGVTLEEMWAIKQGQK